MTFTLAIAAALLWLKFVCGEVDPDELHGLSSGNNTVLGEPAFPGQYAFQVIFYERYPREVMGEKYLSPICSGTIITTRWVLTTAVPLGNYMLRTYVMVAGLLEIPYLSPETTLNNTKNLYDINRVVIHPHFHYASYNNLGMVQTARTLILGQEIGVHRTTAKLFALQGDTTNCFMNIWASTTMDHLLGYYQATDIIKQTIQFKVADGPKYCPNIAFSYKTLCLVQVDPNRRKDVCMVNYGGLITCRCHVLGMFIGFKGYSGCVDQPRLTYAAANLSCYADWINRVINKNYREQTYREVSCGSVRRLRFNLLFLIGIIMFIK